MKTKAQREAIEQRLQELADRHRCRPTPDMVIEDAKRKDSPLHGEFEWDLKKAAYAAWVERARVIIASVDVIIHTEHVTISVPAYVRDPSCAPHEQGYIAITELRTDQEASRAFLIAEFTRVGDLLRRARRLAIALEMDHEVERILSGVMELRERLQQPQASGMM